MIARSKDEGRLRAQNFTQRTDKALLDGRVFAVLSRIGDVTAEYDRIDIGQPRIELSPAVYVFEHLP